MIIIGTAYCIVGVVCFYLIARMTIQSDKDTCKTLDWLEEELKK